MQRTAAALWLGDLRSGDGTLSTHSATLDQAPYSMANRFGASPGTNPEELIAAAHAGCYTMALCAALTQAGFSPRRILTQARVSFEQLDGSWTLTASHLETRASVPGISAEQFAQLSAQCQESCPVSRALKLPITLQAQLDADG